LTPEKYLRDKGYTPKRAPGEWLIRCFVCGDSKNQRHAHLYVNQEHGAWKCHRCGATGSFADLQKAHGDEPEPTQKEAAARWLVLHRALRVCQDILLDYPLTLKYLRDERKLNADTIGKYQVGYMDDTFVRKMRDAGYTLADLREAGLIGEKSNRPLFENRIIVPYMNRENVVTLRGKQVGGNWLQARGIGLGLFGVDNIRAQEGDVYVCEGEFDTMYLDQLGYPVVGLPGADTFQEQWTTWFEKSRRVFIVLDADDAGRKGAEKIKGALGPKARVVELPVPDQEDTTDIQEYFLRDGYSTNDFDKLIDSYRGTRLFTVADALIDREELKLAEGLQLGWKELDHWIHPGILPGQVMVVLAKTGVGKTAWVTQVLHNLSEYYIFSDHQHQAVGPAVPVLMLSLEQTKAELVERMWRISRFWDPWMDDDQFKLAYRNVRLNDENRIPPDDLRHLVSEFTEEVETMPKVLILDYLGYWARSFKGKSRYEQVSDAIMELKSFAKEFGVSIIVPHQVSRVGKRGERLELDFARDSGVVEETADFAFSLWAPHAKEDREGTELGVLQRADVRIEILKSRHGGLGRETRMLWAPASLALPPAGDPTFKALVMKEYDWVDRGKLYEDIHRAHRGGYP
jgi:hypothetical protein